jgi:cobalt-zinc-cadmium efflux system outer membrane protein
MRIGASTILVCAAVWLCEGTTCAQGAALTLADVLARARAQAPQIISARLALDELRGRLVGASLRFQSNPELDVGLGRRHGELDRYTDFEVGVRQNLEPSARRDARMAGANAGLAQGTANVDEATRLVLREAAAAYYRAVHANDRIRLLSASYELATTVLGTADRRFKAGDIAVLDVNIARSALGRIRAEREGAEAGRAAVLGDLRRLLGLNDIQVEGSVTPPVVPELAALLQEASQRPELRALEAGIAEAEAEMRLGLAQGKTEYSVGGRYAREEGDQIVFGGVTIRLPLFSAGQEQRAVGSARAARLRAELESARTRVEWEIRSMHDSLTRRASALRILETEALPGLDENERLTTRSYEVGQLGLPELLLIRRETLDTRAQYLDALLEAALARIDLDASAGTLR